MSTANSLIYPLPCKHDYGIGIVGAGGIVNYAHLPAYRKAGLNIIGICDINENAVRNSAQKWEIPFSTTDYRELLKRNDIQIIDIAIPNEGRVDIVKEAVAAGKHILIQKPFAHQIEQAEEMVRSASEHGVRLAVNQNARFAPFYRKAKEIIDSGILGELYLMTHEMRINQDEALAGTWFAKVPNFLLVDYEIHHLDLMRFWSGSTPERVYTSGTRMPGQHIQSDMTVLTTMEFASGLRASLITVDTLQSNQAFWSFTVEGTKGSLYGRISHDYTVFELDYYTKDNPGQWTRVTPPGRWFVDAFYGSMFELMNAIQENREPSISGRDNLETLRLLHSMIRSTEKKMIVSVE
ncbi:Gfo/Idh/MocA family protein [Cohnella zeiphila]|uniref:Gfo/Idh/MocA family oxidoreductase n=1 Tax=Cohnella zeiphila TaxID=2761120 RepID=A0A7X0SRY0_9BACL|nr:Gfo/Idh/MocA family oxidoreductase [Cohnella zeiphila]MBB6732753.1 Gfo/Idh/MocA family oxidoreductase [Cohnella zeiphila]